ncbi:hypothetical protein D3C85_1504350 [compost metagenome]
MPMAATFVTALMTDCRLAVAIFSVKSLFCRTWIAKPASFSKLIEGSVSTAANVPRLS